jgi:hypothetical protein
MNMNETPPAQFNPIHLKRYATRITPENSSLMFNSNQDVKRTENGISIAGTFDFAPLDYDYSTERFEAVEQAFGLYLHHVQESEFDRVVVNAFWNVMQQKRIIQVFGVVGEYSNLLFAGRY